jgi:prolipoprotein diacylglyceryltransferase
MFMRQVKKNKNAWSEDYISGLFLGHPRLLVGARIFATIVYDTTGENTP